MDVSVIIVNYNTFELTCSCIDSVMQLTEELTYEIILVDNASTECSPDLFSKKFPEVKLIKNLVNAGFTGGNNQGIKIAKGDVILLLNSDVKLTENSIAKCFEVLKGNSKIGLVTCMLRFPNGGVQRQCQRFPSIVLTTIELLRIHKLIPQPKRGVIMENGFFDHLSSIYCDSVWGAFFMFPRKILEDFENKQLPGHFFMYSEDLMWCYMIKKNGYLIYYNAETSVIHHLGASSSSSVLKLKHKNEYDFIVKYYGWFYAKILVFLRGLLYKTSSGRNYATEISRIYFTLFFKGKLS
ncbi:MAG TPA: glycosyltransferase family 2 protein [Bacteroidia bacterium]|nr:glycosyltransferase family 2 protein [Bacteroidia bacterium]